MNYATVTSRGDCGVQIINLADPSSPVAVSSILSTSSGFYVQTPFSADHFMMGGEPHVIIFSTYGFQVVNVVDPSSPTPVVNGKEDEDGYTALNSVYGGSVFEANGGTTYVIMVAHYESGFQIAQLTQ